MLAEVGGGVAAALVLADFSDAHPASKAAALTAMVRNIPLLCIASSWLVRQPLLLAFARRSLPLPILVGIAFYS